MNALALKVKLNDIKNNMDISRIPYPTPRIYEKLERYNKAYQELLEVFLDNRQLFPKTVMRNVIKKSTHNKRKLISTISIKNN